MESLIVPKRVIMRRKERGRKQLRILDKFIKLLLVTLSNWKMKEDRVVKIDKKLLKQIEELIRKNKFIYSNKKQVVNLAILEFLNSKLLSNKKRGQNGHR